MKNHFRFGRVLVLFAAVLLIASPLIQTSTAQTAAEAPKSKVAAPNGIYQPTPPSAAGTATRAPKSTMAPPRLRAPTTPPGTNSGPKVGIVTGPCTGCGCAVIQCQQGCQPPP